MDILLLATMIFNLFLIIDPVGCLPLFITITKSNTPAQRRKMILKATIIAFFVLSFFAIVGKPLLDYFGIGIPAMKIAGGILLFIIGIEMLYGRVSRTETTEKEEKEAIRKQDVSVTPLAIPLLAGPGAITAVMLFTGSAVGFSGVMLVILAIFLVLAIAYILLRLSGVILKYSGQLGVTVAARVMGLLLVFMASQLVVDGLGLLGIVKL